ncbi:MAG: type II toxin-antitoxin system VapB family antitoxin [Chloroflexi bacterium]|nr:type II toxin-antitoxin system VapB family antitoxin [Chloroflexota bacterium]
MRTTIRLDDHLLKEAKRLAADTGRTLTAVIEDSLREAIARKRAGVPRKRVRLPTFKGQGLQPGVDLNDSAALLDLMERPDVAP